MKCRHTKSSHHKRAPTTNSHTTTIALRWHRYIHVHNRERGCDYFFFPRRTLLAPPAKSSKKVSGLPASLRRNPPGVAVIELHRATNKCCLCVCVLYYVLVHTCPAVPDATIFSPLQPPEAKPRKAYAPLIAHRELSRMRSPESLYWPTSSLRVPLHRYPPLVNTGRNLLRRGADKELP